MIEKIIKEKEVLDIFSKETEKDIVEIQVYKNYVFLFESTFLWFRKRYRITIDLYNSILNYDQGLSYNDIYAQISARYIKLINSYEYNFIDIEFANRDHILKMLETIIKNKEMPLDKKARWFGFIQGVLTLNGIISVSEEREITRPLFHSVYKENNESISKINL